MQPIPANSIPAVQPFVVEVYQEEEEQPSHRIMFLGNGFDDDQPSNRPALSTERKYNHKAFDQEIPNNSPVTTSRNTIQNAPPVEPPKSTFVPQLTAVEIYIKKYYKKYDQEIFDSDNRRDGDTLISPCYRITSTLCGLIPKALALVASVAGCLLCAVGSCIACCCPCCRRDYDSVCATTSKDTAGIAAISLITITDDLACSCCSFCCKCAEQAEESVYPKIRNRINWKSHLEQKPTGNFRLDMVSKIRSSAAMCLLRYSAGIQRFKSKQLKKPPSVETRIENS